MMKWKRYIYSFIIFCEIPLTNYLKFPKEKAKPTQILWKHLWKLLKKPVCFNHNKHFMQFQRTILQTPPPQHQQPNKSSTSNKTKTQTNMYSHLTCPTHSPTYLKDKSRQQQVNNQPMRSQATFWSFQTVWLIRQTKTQYQDSQIQPSKNQPPLQTSQFQAPLPTALDNGRAKGRNVITHTHTHTCQRGNGKCISQEMAMCLVLPISAKTNI